jgi:glycosyltransferase involved in cell wall biosynthesis
MTGRGEAASAAPLRILSSSDEWQPDNVGGSGRSAAGAVRALAGRGHSVTMLVPSANGSPPVEWPERRLAVVRVLPRSSFPQTLTDPIAAFLAGRGGPRPDVLFAHQVTVAVGLGLAQPRVPLVFSLHGASVPERRFAARGLPSPRERLAAGALVGPLRALERHAFARAARIILPSEFARARLATAHPEAASRALVLPFGVDVEAFAPADGPDAARARLGVPADATLLFAARRLEPHTGVELLLRALTLVDANAVLAVAGGGRLEAHLRAQAVELGLAARVRFLGPLEDPDLAEWYRAADLAVVPSRALETFGTATLEALASGTPVVTTPVGGTPEVLAPLDRRLVAAGPDSESLAAAIDRALRLPSGIRARCRAYVEEGFTWERLVPAWEAVLTEAAGR